MNRSLSRTLLKNRHIRSLASNFSSDYVVSDSNVNLTLDLLDKKGPSHFILGAGLENYDSDLVSWLEHFLDENSVFLDIGSNIGQYSFLLSQRTQCTSYAFEPMPRNCALIEKSCGLNNLKVTPMKMAVGSRKETATIYKNSKNNGGNSLVQQEHLQECTFKIQVETLDSLLDSFSGPVKAMKLDIEGHECEALRGATELLKQQKPAIVFEFTPSLSKVPSEPFTLLNEAGYLNFYEATDKGIVPLSNTRKDEVIAGKVQSNICAK